MRHRIPLLRDSPQDTGGTRAEGREQAPLPPLPRRASDHEHLTATASRCCRRCGRDGGGAITRPIGRIDDTDTRPLPPFLAAPATEPPASSRRAAVAELVLRKPKPLWFAPEPLRLSAEESAQTEELVNALLDTAAPASGTPDSPGVRAAVGTLCTALLVGAAVATATLTGVSPATGDDLLGGDPEPAEPAVESVQSPQHPRQVLAPEPAADVDAVTTAREFYDHLDRSPALAMPRLAPGLPATDRGGPDGAWREAVAVRPLLLRAESPQLVRALVEVKHPDGSHSLLRHLLHLGADGRVEVQLRSFQHFPR
ncbi:hypothetical protein ABZ805_09085 [Saccharopolyspora sp. NPDC047091]|uniref:hypothetical protein n=1 Tax=Saccharopolyspora sp. NPDC047091 TaxID=3155924 RepID=UPI0033C252DC